MTACGDSGFLSRKTGISPWIIGGITAAGAAYVLASPQRRQAVGRYVMPVPAPCAERVLTRHREDVRSACALGEVLRLADANRRVRDRAGKEVAVFAGISVG